jgi:hypothetical protein
MRILIFYPPNKLGMSDFRPTDYTTLAERARKELDGKIPNFGNKVWLQGIISAISVSRNAYEYGYDDLTPDYINNNFDCVLLPLANCFYKGWIKYLEKRTSYIEKIKIPVYVIACGIQADSYDEIDGLVEDLKTPATKFIKSVYDTGGEFALRGYFTEEFFYRLGFKDAVVTGCPSLFQMGRDLSISNDKASKSDFTAAINGTFKLPITRKNIKIVDFVCQDKYGKFLYDPEYIKNNPFTLRRILKYVKRGDYDFVQALADNRIKLFADTQQWMSYYVQNDVNFSFGSRIHGTIMPILSGVPSLCYTMDARTREMTEFFDIPHIKPSEDLKNKDLYDWYLETDYSKFNENYPKKFDAYESFLRKCGLVEHINQENIFMSRDKDDVDMPVIVNRSEIDEISKLIKKNKLIINALDLYYRK